MIPNSTPKKISALGVLALGRDDFVDTYLTVSGMLARHLKRGKRRVFRKKKTQGLKGSELDIAARRNEELRKEKTRYDDEQRKAFIQILNSLDDQTRQAVVNHPQYLAFYKNKKENPFKLLNLLFGLGKEDKLNLIGLTAREKAELESMKQGPNEDTLDFLNRWLKKYDRVRNLSGTGKSTKVTASSLNLARALIRSLNRESNWTFLSHHESVTFMTPLAAQSHFIPSDSEGDESSDSDGSLAWESGDEDDEEGEEDEDPIDAVDAEEDEVEDDDESDEEEPSNGAIKLKKGPWYRNVVTLVSQIRKAYMSDPRNQTRMSLLDNGSLTLPTSTTSAMVAVPTQPRRTSETKRFKSLYKKRNGNNNRQGHRWQGPQQPEHNRRERKCRICEDAGEPGRVVRSHFADQCTRKRQRIERRDNHRANSTANNSTAMTAQNLQGRRVDQAINAILHGH